MPYFDGHLHSNASDGQLAPAALVGVVAEAGVRCLALTDHDTFAGLAEARTAAAARGLGFVPGAELSTALAGREVHLLAYFVDEGAGELTVALTAAREARRDRLAPLLARLAELGLPVSLEEVLAGAGGLGGDSSSSVEGAGKGASIGRPHVARAMIRRGYVATVQEAFDRWLGEGKPGYVPRPLPEAAATVALACRAGAVVAVAHPGTNRLTAGELHQLRAAGLAGIEVHHPDHDVADQLYYLRECQRLDLVPTGGSDFHGGTFPRRGDGLDRAGYERLAALARRR